jgi:6,7-dimethyl-8-ribityllumazine synthase
MPNTLEGRLEAQGRRFAIVVSRFNELVSQQLLAGALDCLRRHGADTEKDVVTVWVPGSFEIPVTALKLGKSGKFDAVICLGALIRGHTPHFDYIAAESTKGIGKVAMTTGVPTAYGMITADTLEQALERAGTKAGNKGWDAALSAIEMVNLFEQL